VLFFVIFKETINNISMETKNFRFSQVSQAKEY